MGVQGLWEILNKVGHSRALTHLAVVDGFEKNESGQRAFRVGIDASIWYQHAQTPGLVKGDVGANPELRLLFFRLGNLSKLPILPLFIFDGHERPKVKRGSRMGKSGSHNLTSGFKKLLDVFGMEWRMALGEAEAELAHLNREGVIDAIMTDDVDAFVFGARTIIKNASNRLSGNKSNPAKNAEGKDSKSHVMVYNANDIHDHPEIGLSRGGLILFALLSGGDYDPGIKGCGPQIAHGLARCGFGDQLFSAFQRNAGRNMSAFLVQWRNQINTELRTNSRGLLPHKCPSISLPAGFPDLTILEAYVNPMCSARVGRQGGGTLRDSGDLSLPRIATFCEDHFDEWAHRSLMIYRFRKLLWEGALMRVLRRAALEADEKEKSRRLAAGRTDVAIRGPLEPTIEDGVGTSATLVKKYLDPKQVDRIAAAFVNKGPQPPSASTFTSRTEPNPLIVRIVGCRQGVRTDKLPEYRAEVDPAQFVDLANTGIKGKHPENAGRKALVLDAETIDSILGVGSQQRAKPLRMPPANSNPYDLIRVWLPASLMRQVHPQLVQQYLDGEEAKKAKKVKKSRAGKGKARAPQQDDEEASGIPPKAKAPRKRAPKVSQKDPTREDEARMLSQASSSQNTAGSFAASSAHLTTSITIPVNAESSLPQRKSGFIFTFPNPDNPDQLLVDVDEPEIDGYDIHADFIRPHEDAVMSNSTTALERTDADGTRRSELRERLLSIGLPPPKAKKSSAKRKKASSKSVINDVSVEPSVNDEENGADEEDPFDTMVDNLLGVGKGTTKASAPKRKRPRASAPEASSSQAQPEGSKKPAKRRKTMNGQVSSFASTSATQPIGPAPFPDLPPLDYYSPPPSPHTLPRCALDTDVIEIPSDHEAFDCHRTFAKQRLPCHRENRQLGYPSSSQESGLGTNVDEFLNDAQVVIDLT